MPVLVAMYIRHVLWGFVLSVIFTGLLFWLNVGNLWHLVIATSGGYVAVLMLLVFNTIVFGGVQFGIAVMRMEGEDDDPKGGRRDAVPLAVPAKARLKKIAVSMTEAATEPHNGAFHQLCWRSRLNTATSSSCETMKAVPEASAMRHGATSPDTSTATAKPAQATRRAACGPMARLVRSHTRNTNG